jgi:hypothetical protein
VDSDIRLLLSFVRVVEQAAKAQPEFGGYELSSLEDLLPLIVPEVQPLRSHLVLASDGVT